MSSSNCEQLLPSLQNCKKNDCGEVCLYWTWCHFCTTYYKITLPSEFFDDFAVSPGRYQIDHYDFGSLKISDAEDINKNSWL